MQHIYIYIYIISSPVEPRVRTYKRMIHDLGCQVGRVGVWRCPVDVTVSVPVLLLGTIGA